MADWPVVKQHLPIAAKAQLGVVDDEWRLVVQAQITHPRVTWWHGIRMGFGKTGSYCYLCDDYAVTWDSNMPITRSAQFAIEYHRDRHIRKLPKVTND